MIGLEKIKYNMQRHEIKFLLNEEQYTRLLPLLSEHMEPDPYGRYEVRSLYYDTDDYAIIRACMDHPRYKEKFRLRSYGAPRADTPVFAEIKKKFKGITYKRRVDLPLSSVPAFLSGEYDPDENEQITREIRWFLGRTHPVPKVLIQYDREPYEGVTEPLLRITFDRNVRWRTDRLRLTDDGADRSAPAYDGAAGQADPAEGAGDTLLLPEGSIIMEVKTPDTLPLWLCRFLSDEGIYRTGFSKYGVCYQRFILPTIIERTDTLC